MATTAALPENSRQGINSEIPPGIGIEARLSPNPRLGCGHAYDETPVGLVVYVRNDPVNLVDTDGKDWVAIGNYSYWVTDGFFTIFSAVPNTTIVVTAEPPPPPMQIEVVSTFINFRSPDMPLSFLRF